MRLPKLLAVSLLVALPLSATEPNPSIRQRAAIEKLFVAMNLDATVRDSVDAIYEAMEKQIVDVALAEGGSPERVAEAKEVFSAFRERMAKIDLGGEFRETYLRIYAKYFTAEEIDAMTAFYTTPAGRKSIELMPQLMREGMQVGIDHLGPKVDQALRDAMEDAERKRPWRRTMRDIRGVATALEAWAIDNDDKYPAGDYASLEEHLVPEYIDELPAQDMWDHAYAYVVSPDRTRYRLVSAGADTIFEWDSRRIAADSDVQAETKYRERLEDDLIFADGMFVQAPVQAKAAE